MLHLLFLLSEHLFMINIISVI